MQSSDDVVVTEAVDHVLVITLNRPEVKNAINTDLSKRLRAALDELDADDDLRVGVMVGSGGVFCAGLDLREFARSGSPKGVKALLRNGSAKPLLAAVEGVALGGGLELALMADILVAASDARLGLPEVRVGLFAGGGALHRLPTMMPLGAVAELAFTGEPVSAERARELGLVSRVTEPGRALDEARALAATIARNAPLGLAATKELIRACQGVTPDEFWQRQHDLAVRVFNSEDAREGAAAFAERRSPAWRNR